MQSKLSFPKFGSDRNHRIFHDKSLPWFDCNKRKKERKEQNDVKAGERGLPTQEATDKKPSNREGSSCTNSQKVEKVDLSFF